MLMTIAGHTVRRGATVEMIDKLTAAGQRATERARESVHEAQLKHDLAHAYSELGHTTFTLVQQGAVTEARLASRVGQISELETQLAAVSSSGASSPGAGASHATGEQTA